MSEKIVIKPKAGLKILNPVSMLHLPESGELVEHSSFWARRLKDGSVELVSQDKSSQKNSESKVKEGEK